MERGGHAGRGERGQAGRGERGHAGCEEGQTSQEKRIKFLTSLFYSRRSARSGEVIAH